MRGRGDNRTELCASNPLSGVTTYEADGSYDFSRDRSCPHASCRTETVPPVRWSFLSASERSHVISTLLEGTVFIRELQLRYENHGQGRFPQLILMLALSSHLVEGLVVPGLSACSLFAHHGIVCCVPDPCPRKGLFLDGTLAVKPEEGRGFSPAGT